MTQAPTQQGRSSERALAFQGDLSFRLGQMLIYPLRRLSSVNRTRQDSINPFPSGSKKHTDSSSA